jgi:hypothetical protein
MQNHEKPIDGGARNAEEQQQALHGQVSNPTPVTYLGLRLLDFNMAFARCLGTHLESSLIAQCVALPLQTAQPALVYEPPIGLHNPVSVVGTGPA